VIRSMDVSQDGRRRDQCRANGENQPVGGLFRRTDKPNGVAQAMGVLKIDGLNASNSVGIDIGGRNLLAESESSQDRELRPSIEAVNIRSGIGFRKAEALCFPENLVEIRMPLL